jgi:L-iditol 2-dehydrogenase
MPAFMHAMMFPEAGRAEIVEVPIPAPGTGEVLVRVRAAGICASDVEAFKGKHDVRRPPVITGHELAGEVFALGPGPATFAVGDRVAVEPHVGCGTCTYCRRGDHHVCHQKRYLGVGDWTGAFAEYAIATESMCHRMPVGMSYEEGAALEPFCVGLHAARLARIQVGDRVAILGGGTIGLMTLLAARLAGPGWLLLSEVSAAKRAVGTMCGADRSVDPRRDDVVEEIRRATGGIGVDVVFVAVAVPEVLQQALEACRRMGTLVVVAAFFQGTGINARHVQGREQAVLGTHMYTAEDYRLAIRLWEAGRLELRPLLTERIALAEAPSAVAALAANAKPDNIKSVIVFP